MTKKVMLPFKCPPDIRAFQNIAFSMGIIQESAKSDIAPWMCEKYINCNFSPQRQNIQFYLGVEDIWTADAQILSKQRINFFPRLTEHLSCNYIDLMRAMMDLGYYPFGVCNEEFIPGKRSYQKKYYAHDFLIIGYDDEQQILYSVGYLSDGSFSLYKIPYGNMLKALETLRPSRVVLDFWRYNQKFKYELHIDKIKQDMKDYLSSSTVIKQHIVPCFFGVEAIYQLGQYFFNEKLIDYRYTRALMEHKYLMRFRINYFLKNGYVNDELLLEKAENVYNISQRIHMLGLKWNLTYNESIIAKVIELINHMLVIEREYLSIFYVTL